GAFTSVTIGIAAAAEQRRPMEFDDLVRAQRLSDPQISPDGATVAYVVTRADKSENRTDSDIWLVPLAGGEPRQLTASPKHDRHPRWSPDGKWIVFESNRGGAFQLYLIPSDGGEARQLTTISTEATQPIWSPDGRRIAFVSAVFPEFSDKPSKESDELNKKKLDEREKSKVKARVITRLLYRHWDSWVDDKRQHLFVVPVKGGEADGDPRNLTPGDRDAIPTSSTFSAGDDFDFSPDGRKLAYTATPTPAREEAWLTNHDIYEVDVDSGERRQITTNPAADAFPRYSPDGKWIAFRAQTRAGFEADRWQLMLYDRAAGKTQSLTPDFDSWVEAFVWAPNSQTLYFDAEEQAAKPLWSATINAKSVRKVVDKAVNGEVTVSPDGKTLVFSRQTLSRPAEFYRASADGGDVRPITHANDTLFAGISMIEPESISYTGAGGAKIQMWIVKPPGFDPARKYPFVFWVHGGPQGAYLDSWSYRWNAQLWSAQGYVLAMPNPRGSTGFGQKFVDEISHDWGGKVVEDLMAGLGHMEKQRFVDTTRMAAAGASYGGYVMNWFQGHTDKFKTLVTHCGVYNFATMYGTTEELWFDEWDHGIPWETPDFDKFSPDRFAAKFKTPNLIIHNELDFRVPIGQGISLFTTLQRKGVPSKLLYFPDEGHWVLKPQNSELWHRTIFDWLAEYLKR
ncbi:MAG TPA: S9 family peptidase, partial [Verrucomicrobiae bacterium]|nr:S9 family peptidase [Verrucomicrobiae bacterium]